MNNKLLCGLLIMTFAAGISTAYAMTGIILDGDVTITGDLTCTDCVDNSDIADNSITTLKILDGQISTGDILDGQVTSADIQNNSIVSEKILDGQVKNEDIADNSITTEKILDGQISTGDILDGQVTSADIQNNSIVSEKILDGQVRTEDIADGTIIAADLSPSAIGCPADKIQHFAKVRAVFLSGLPIKHPVYGDLGQFIQVIIALNSDQMISKENMDQEIFDRLNELGYTNSTGDPITTGLFSGIPQDKRFDELEYFSTTCTQP